jgi:hypothetical protein
MNVLTQRRRIKWIILMIFFGIADVWSSLPVDLAPEEKGTPYDSFPCSYSNKNQIQFVAVLSIKV